MKTDFRRLAALAACFTLFSMHSASAQRQSEYLTANNAAMAAGESLASYNSFDAFGGDNYDSGQCNSNCGGCCGCDTCSGGRLELGNGLLNRRGQFFFGADYLFVRSTFSESNAFVTRTQSANGAVTNVFTKLEYDYESSYRAFGGYRLCECGGEIQFAFNRYQSGGTAGRAGADQANLPPGVASIQIIAGGALVALDPNARIDVDSRVDLKSYDLSFAKTIPLGSAICSTCDSCTSGYDCGDCCECRICPAWDITWSAGIRVANVDWDRRASSTTTNTGQPNRFANARMEFDGGGPRWGMEGRRYVGKRQLFSFFAKGDISILLGKVAIDSNVNDAQFASFDSTQLVPVLDITAGTTMYIGSNATLSAGYLFSAWHDLGMRDTFPILETDTGLTFDDANILGFDGLFARAEVAF